MSSSSDVDYVKGSDARDVAMSSSSDTSDVEYVVARRPVPEQVVAVASAQEDAIVCIPSVPVIAPVVQGQEKRKRRTKAGRLSHGMPAIKSPYCEVQSRA